MVITPYVADRRGGNTVNKLSNKPLYDQVFDQIKDMIRSGTYCAGISFPAKKN